MKFGIFIFERMKIKNYLTQTKKHKQNWMKIFIVANFIQCA